MIQICRMNPEFKNYNKHQVFLELVIGNGIGILFSCEFDVAIEMQVLYE